MVVSRHTLGSEREIKSQRVKAKSTFCRGKLHVAWFIKGSKKLLLLGRAKAMPSFTGTAKTIEKPFLSYWQCGNMLVNLTGSFCTGPPVQRAVLVPCKNNDRISPEIISQEVFLAEEKFSLSLYSVRKIVKCLRPTPNDGWFTFCESDISE